MKNTLSLFQDSWKEKKLVEVYDDHEECDDFHVGYIRVIFDDSILLQSYDKYGLFNGIMLIRLVDIIKIATDTEYLKNMLYFIENPFILYKTNYPIPDPVFNNFEEGIRKTISHCENNKILLTIKLICNDFITGYIVESNDECLILKSYSHIGVFDGDIIIKYEDVASMGFDRKKERMINILINQK